MTSDFSAAVHALVYLCHSGLTVSSETLAENVCTHPARIRKIMAKLKKAGLVTSREGKSESGYGGYSLGADASQLTLCSVFRALDERMVGASWKPGDIEKPCAISSGMAAMLDDLYNDMEMLCRDKLKGMTILDIERKICIELKSAYRVAADDLPSHRKEPLDG